MKPLIWKEFRENFKWAAAPSLLFLLPMILMGFPDQPPAGVELFAFHVVVALFGAGLGFVQIFFEARGDQRSLLMHRPLTPSKIFLGKAIGGLGVYLLAVTTPFAVITAWCVTPGRIAAPFDWGLTLPWLADILAGMVYYFAGMLTAQREARWYGSRCLGLGAGMVCTILVWTLPEFGLALAPIVVLGTLAGVAAWGSFITGGAYAPQPPLAKAALAGTLLTGLLFVGFVAKLMVGQGLDPGISQSTVLDRQGRVLFYAWKLTVGPIPPLTDQDGNVPPDLQGKRVDRNAISDIEAPMAPLNFPKFRSYRNPGRFLVEFFNDTMPGKELWWYAPAEGRLLGYDEDFHQFIGSFGPDGFVPAGEPPGQRFPGDLLHVTRGWDALPPPYLAFAGGVFDVDFAHRTVRTLYRPVNGETVLWASRWKDPRKTESLAIISTDRSVHVVTEAGHAVLSAPVPFDREHYRVRQAGRLDDPQRFAMWYSSALIETVRTSPRHLLEYDRTGHEIARRTVPPSQPPEPSFGMALLGLATPMTEAGALIWTNRHLRLDERATGERWILLMFFEDWVSYMIPGAERGWAAKPGLVPAYIMLMLLSAAGSALVCLMLARRYAFSWGRCLAWALCGVLFGVVGVLLMLCLQQWPALVRCPSCGRQRRVDRERCEHCGAAHALPAPDGTEIFEAATEDAVASRNPVCQTAALNAGGAPWTSRLTIMAIAWLLSLAPAIASPPAQHRVGDVVMERASFSTSEAGTVEYDLGTLFVPENRADPRSRIIGVGFARFRAAKATGAPPTFHLPGGPGGSFLMPLTKSKPSPSALAYVELFRAVGDVVLVDQRGYSARGDVLTFSDRTPQPLDQPANLARHTAAFVETARAATLDLGKKGIDLRGYTVKECADDVNDLRKALGYERVTLVGGSFGSQWSFAVLRRHPGTVARALLAGVEPLNCGYDVPSHVLAAVQRQWWDAEKDSRLKPYLPPGGLMAAAQEVLQQLERAPWRVELTDDTTGKPVAVVLGPEDFRKHFLQIADHPSLLLALYHGRARAMWARAVLGERRQGVGEIPLIGPLIDTSLGVTPRREHLMRIDPASSLLGHWNFDAYLATADIWPSPDVGDDFRTETGSDVPVVFVQGDWDTSTPVENLLDVVPYFAKGRTLLVERGDHGALGAIIRHRPDVLATLVEFLKTGATNKLPARVTLPTPKFAVPDFPPPQRQGQSPPETKQQCGVRLDRLATVFAFSHLAKQ